LLNPFISPTNVHVLFSITPNLPENVNVLLRETKNNTRVTAGKKGKFYGRGMVSEESERENCFRIAVIEIRAHRRDAEKKLEKLLLVVKSGHRCCTR
jgi:hypothetical protein